jgi:hypothetical protein
MTSKYLDLARPVRAAWMMVLTTIILLAGLFEV